jgi:Domain of unknown function (DUF4360)
MKIVRVLFAVATFIAASISPAVANSKVEILGINYGGNGCAANSASVGISFNARDMIILFDKFIALGNNPAESRKSCNLSIPIKVPPGFQISIYNADYRGYVSSATTANLRAEYFFAGARGPVFTHSLTGETKYNVKDSSQALANVWSRCGDSVNLRVNASITARGSGMATVNALRLANIHYRTCQQSS